MTRQANILPELQWRTKGTSKGALCSSAVTVSLTKASKNAADSGAKRVNLTFRDSVWKQFNTEYLAVAIFKNKMYFKGVDKRDGYHIVVKNTSGYVSFQLTKEEVAEWESFIGDYSLKFNEDYELYYIERNAE